jgi:hypothetical protein
MSQIEGFQGLVLAIALEEQRSLDSVYRLFGRENLVKHRNHQRAVRESFGKLRRLMDTLGEKPSASLQSILEQWQEKTSR